jgi:hypothetical protein
MYRSTFLLTSGLDASEWSTPRPGRFTTGEKDPGTRRIGRWVSRRADLKEWRTKNSRPYRDSNSDPSVVQPVGSRYTNCAIAAPLIKCSFQKSVSNIRILNLTRVTANSVKLVTVYIVGELNCCFVNEIK